MAPRNAPKAWDAALSPEYDIQSGRCGVGEHPASGMVLVCVSTQSVFGEMDSDLLGAAENGDGISSAWERLLDRGYAGSGSRAVWTLGL